MTVVEYENPVGYLHERLRDGLAGAKAPVSATSTRTEKIHKKWQLSRAAYLQLINQLARVGPTGVLVVLFVAGWVSVMQFSQAPLQTAVWASMVGLVGTKLLIRNRSFLAGDAKVSSRPFHWRACHTANMAVFGTAFGAGMIMLIPAAEASVNSLTLIIIIMSAAIFATATQLAHGRTALAMIIPVLFFSGWAAFKTGLPATVITIGCGMLIVVATVFALISIMIVRKADKRYPRTVYDNMARNVSRLPFRRKVVVPPSVDRASHQAFG